MRSTLNVLQRRIRFWSKDYDTAERAKIVIQQTDYGWYLKLPIKEKTRASMISRFDKTIKEADLEDGDFLEVILNVAEWPLTAEQASAEIQELIE